MGVFIWFTALLTSLACFTQSANAGFVLSTLNYYFTTDSGTEICVKTLNMESVVAGVMSCGGNYCDADIDTQFDADVWVEAGQTCIAGHGTQAQATLECSMWCGSFMIANAELSHSLINQLHSF